MQTYSCFSFRWRQATAVVLLAGLASSVPCARAADGSPSAITLLISRLAEKGTLTKTDAADLTLLAEAEAAEAGAQAAALKAAEARVAAAEARARALAALLAHSGGAVAAAQPALEAPQEPVVVRRPAAVSPVDPVVAQAVARHEAVRSAADLASAEAPPPRRARLEPEPALAPEPAVEPEREEAPEPPAPVRPRRAAPVVAAAEPAEAETPESEATTAAAAEQAGDDTVRVTYVPEVVRQQLREQVKQDVLDEAREEGWATPRAVPDWVGRFRFFGDLRSRAEGIHFPAGNDNTGAFPNFNAINTGAPYDVAGTVFSPQYNVDQDRNRFRLRARLGSAIDLGDSFTGGLRIATGDSNSPVTQNQTVGGAGTGQGGNFSKYALWLDRAFLRYELGGLPDQDLMITIGRQDNPFLSTSMLWADDLGFDGLSTQGRLGLADSVTGFLAAGVFPVFNTDLNFATNQPAKFKSTDKWLYAMQLGANLDLGEHFVVKLAAAYYPFSGVEGRKSTPFTPVAATDAGDTDSTRPAFAQRGNTYMALRDITPGPLNQQGSTNQFQYFGLASKFRPVVGDVRIEFNQFEPFQVALVGEYVKNLAFDPVLITQDAVNNRGAATTAEPQGAFLGQDTGWSAMLTLGNAALQKRWDWNFGVGYRKVGSDAMIDGFVDSDFGGGGTNVKGLTVVGNLAFSSRVWLGLRWMSATQAVGPQLKSDIVQLDLNGKF